MKNSVNQHYAEIDLGRLFGLLMDHKWLILFITFLFFVFGAIYATLATPIYRGDALVQVERRASVNPLEQMSAVARGDERESSTAAEVQILKSRMVLGRVVDRLGLDTEVLPKSLPIIGSYVQRMDIPRPSFANNDFVLAGSLPDFLQKYAHLPDSLQEHIRLPSFLQTQSLVWGGEELELGRLEVADYLRGTPIILTTAEDGHYSLSLGGKTPRDVGESQVGEIANFLDGDIKLRIASLDAPVGAQFTLFRHSRALAIRNLANRFDVAEVGGSRDASTGMLKLMLTGVDREEIQRSLNAVAETFLNQNVQRQSAEVDESLAFLEEQAPALRTQLRSAEDSLNEYRSNQHSVDLTSEAQAAIEQFIQLDSQLNELEFKEADLAQRFTKNHPAYQSLLRQKRHLESERAELNDRVDDLPEAQQEVVRRTRDVEVTQAIYVNVLNRMQELQVARAGTIGNVRIIDHAQVDARPIEPKKPRVVMLSTMLGGMLAVSLVLVRGVLNRGIELPEQLEEAELPVYATVPFSNEQKKLVKKVKHRRDRHAFDVMEDLLAERVPTDIAVESLRSLRTSLHFAMLEKKDNRLVITSPTPNIGKSFISANLAAICAQAGQRVLLVDADMRRGHLHHLFNDRSHGGLSELLVGDSHSHDIIRHSGIEGLDYISRGRVPPNPSELLMTSSFSHFCDEVSELYDLVIFDTPPVLAVTDSSVIGALCGTSLLVVRFQVNPVREVLLAVKQLEKSGVKVSGAILNAIERKAANRYGYSYGYNYKYK
nr:polysaccharide biosynthesis tyrosine autokinase [Halomonas fontilapidosi]